MSFDLSITTANKNKNDLDEGIQKLSYLFAKYEIDEVSTREEIKAFLDQQGWIVKVLNKFLNNEETLFNISFRGYHKKIMKDFYKEVIYLCKLYDLNILNHQTGEIENLSKDKSTFDAW